MEYKKKLGTLMYFLAGTELGFNLVIIPGGYFFIANSLKTTLPNWIFPFWWVYPFLKIATILYLAHWLSKE